ncbi:hypothetical protein OESDEN_16323 [Oesophagostomum dentatum]|uniref:Uncharacterized protein n=1 Tax=Oesophagostomum dentatum TaxID=61180 RepID=A0A0B1SGB3_OESDE|nr:hypothetical protein OESDEN_16323 [Oesophagostomum dentatum]
MPAQAMPPMPQQPVVLFFNQPPMQPMPQPQPQLQQQGPAPPPPPPPHFQPSIGQQNQFPFPVQNQVPIFPQPFVPDVNNNVNTFNDNIQPKPWYVSGDDQRWQQTWENTPIKVSETS